MNQDISVNDRTVYSKRAVQLCLAGATVGLGGLVSSSFGLSAGEVALYAGLFLWMFGTIYWAMAKGYHWVLGLLGVSCIGTLAIALLPNKGNQDPARDEHVDLTTLDPETATLIWVCPKCGKDNLNTTYRCKSCGHSIV